MKGFVKEFKEFIMRGNVVDMAVGVIIGSAFGGIITAFTNDFINPLISLLGGTEIAGQIVLKDAVIKDGATIAEAVTLNWGDFVTVIINFLITAFVLFLLLKGMNKLMSMKKKKEEEAPAAPVKSEELKTLEQIRDLLRKNK